MYKKRFSLAEPIHFQEINASKPSQLFFSLFQPLVVVDANLDLVSRLLLSQRKNRSAASSQSLYFFSSTVHNFVSVSLSLSLSLSLALLILLRNLKRWRPILKKTTTAKEEVNSFPTAEECPSGMDSTTVMSICSIASQKHKSPNTIIVCAQVGGRSSSGS